MCECTDDKPYVPNEYTFGVSHGVWRRINQGYKEFAVIATMNEQGITIYSLPGEVESATSNART